MATDNPYNHAPFDAPFGLFDQRLREKLFCLDDSFVSQYAEIPPKWGPIGYVVYKRTYARIKADGATEEWWETVARVVEGTYQIQQLHCNYNRVPWNADKAQRSAQEMYDRIFNFKFLPPGRGLWMMGTDFVRARGGAACNNCAFVSTENIDKDFAEPFAFLMDMSMLGVGVGGDTRGAGRITITQSRPELPTVPFVVEDTREGWVRALATRLKTYNGGFPVEFDYRLLRPAGAPIRGFGGVASGPEPLRKLLDHDIPRILDPLVGKPITSTAIVDLFNVIGACVVAGNVRRTAEIMFGDPADEEFARLKDPNDPVAAEAMRTHRWASNNSIFADVGMDYSRPAARTAIAGEPGYAWLDNMRQYSRMIDPPDGKDKRVAGSNPCQPAFATVLTPEGVRTFGDIEVGSTIWSGSKWTKVVNKWSTGVKDVYAYRTTAGEFIGTENHRIFQRGERCEVGDADSIDRVVGPCALSDTLDPADVIDGIVFGDGTTHDASKRVLLCVGKDDDYEGTEVAEFIGVPYGGSDYMRTVRSRFSALPLTYARSVPVDIQRGSARRVRGFLRGLYSANGSIVRSGRSGRVTLKVSSRAVRDQVTVMLSSLGIRSYYTTNSPKTVRFKNGEYECRESYDINITTDRSLFRELIGFVQCLKQARLDAICDVPRSPFDRGRPKSTFAIKEVEHLGQFEVFDITVDDEEHCYWTGGLKVSNCAEQSLESFELCCLVETFPAHHNDLDDYLKTCKYAYLYAKTVTLLPTHYPRTNAVMMRNRRIGMSQSGIVQSFGKHGRRTHFEWCDKAYKFTQNLDETYSAWLAVPRSIKTTSVKPSGTVSKLCGATPGIHYPTAEHYIRRVTFAKDHPMVDQLRAHGYPVEDSVYSSGSVVVEFPVKEPYFTKAEHEVSMWEQLENAAQMQAFWADNQVSCTVKFHANEAGNIKAALELYESRLKSISFLPFSHGYAQAPEEPISAEEYERRAAMCTPFTHVTADLLVHDSEDKFCDGGACEFSPE